MALQFSLNMGGPQCYVITGNARKENDRDVDRVQCEARREDVNAKEGVSELIEGLKSLLDSIGEKFEVPSCALFSSTVVELKSAQEECKRMSEENLKLRTQFEQRLKTLEDARVFQTVGGPPAIPMPTTFSAFSTGTNTPTWGNSVIQVPFNTSPNPVQPVAGNFYGNSTNTSGIQTIGIVESTNTEAKTTQASLSTGTNTTGLSNSNVPVPKEAKPEVDKLKLGKAGEVSKAVVSPVAGTNMNASTGSRGNADKGIVSNQKSNKQ